MQTMFVLNVWHVNCRRLTTPRILTFTHKGKNEKSNNISTQKASHKEEKNREESKSGRSVVEQVRYAAKTEERVERGDGVEAIPPPV